MDNIVTQIFMEQVKSQQHILLFGLAFLGGIISSLSPCTMGILPIIVGYVGGCTDNSSKKTIIQITFFVIGLSITLTILGIVAALAGKVLGFHASPVWAIIIASLILIMGLTLLDVLQIPISGIVKKMPQNKNNGLVFYPLMIGGAFAFASSPCSTPILAGIMAYTSLKSNLLFGALLLFSFSVGQGLILVIAGIFTSLFKKMSVFKQFSEYFMKFSGVILILAAVYIYAKVFQIV